MTPPLNLPALLFVWIGEDDDTSGCLPEHIGLSWPDADVFGRVREINDTDSGGGEE